MTQCVLDTHNTYNVKKSRVVVVVVSSRVVKKTFVDDRFVVDDASRRKMR